MIFQKLDIVKSCLDFYLAKRFIKIYLGLYSSFIFFGKISSGEI